MQTHTIYQVDAFTSSVFGGNPAAVMVLDSFFDDTILQAIANENNLAETAFVVPRNESDGWELRWFTPTTEVPLCGHATLAAAHVLVRHLKCTDEIITFHTRQSGQLHVRCTADGRLAMEFPAITVKAVTDTASVDAAFSHAAVSLYVGKLSASDQIYMAVYQAEAEVAALKPDFASLKKLDAFGFIVTAPGVHCDFVSRFFAPAVGIDEDPVTGGAHCLLTPYWSQILEKTQLEARQISPRIGHLGCEYRGDSVVLTGSAVDYMKGEIWLPG